MFRKRPEHFFYGRLHEQVSIKDKKMIANSNISIFHYGYLSSNYVSKGKGQRNYRIKKLMLQQEPNNPFLLFNMGNVCTQLNKFIEAANYYRKALKYIDIKTKYAPSAFIGYITCQLKLGEIDKAIKYAEMCKSIYSDFVDIHYLTGDLYMRLGHLQKARRCFEICLTLGEDTGIKYNSRVGVGSYLSFFKLAQIYQAKGETEKTYYYKAEGEKIKQKLLIHNPRLLGDGTSGFRTVD